jgi:single-stranded-DNA-specific exonuclease
VKNSPPAKWVVSPPAPRDIAQRLGVPPLIAQLLYRLDISELSQLDGFLSSKISNLHDPFSMPGMTKAVKRLVAAAQSQDKIAVFGDFDVDGITATLILVRTLERLGAKVVPYIPHRVLEGHGLNSDAVRKLKEQDVSLIVTVDCGISSQREVAEANSLEMEVIVTDHHTLPQNPPPAYAIISSALEGRRYPFQDLTGAGVAFKLAQGLCQTAGIDLEDTLLELAALGTVGDVAPLLDENRILVREGLRIINRNPSPGVVELCRAAGTDPRAIDTEAISYTLAPRLNASGRLEDSLTAYRLLSATSREEAIPLADELEGMNQERRQLTEEALHMARQEILAQESVPPLLFVSREEFNPGVNGLVASKLVDEFYHPAVVVSLGDVALGSARSIPEFNIANALTQCASLLERHGGHPRAAGFTAGLQNLSSLKQRLVQIAEQRLRGMDLSRHIVVDAEVPLAKLNGEAIQWLNRLQPFGEGNPTPVFLSRGVEVLQVHSMGNGGRHLRLVVRDERVTWDAVAFNMGDRESQTSRFSDLVYSLGVNSWRDRRTLTLRILDMAASS